MPDCAVCGGKEFTPHDGFYYCVECQTQSQDLMQHEVSYRKSAEYTKIKTISKKTKTSKKVKSTRLGDGPPWTSWQAFNYILKGMTDELIALGAPDDFEPTVLQLWACYLKVHHVSFTSKHDEKLPLLSFPFRYRDGKVLYDVDAASQYSSKRWRKRKYRRRSRSTTTKSVSSYSHSRKKMLKSDYESHLSATLNSNTSDVDDVNTTLESLGTSFEDSSPSKPTTPKRKQLTKQSAEKRKESKGKIPSSRGGADHTHHVGRTKVLAILHLALIITRSRIQLSDVFRFIREGHVSFTILSHFLPADVKFGEGDVLFINCFKDQDIPTHTSLRIAATLLARKFKLFSLPAPDWSELVRRYVTELLLPDEIGDLALTLLTACETPSSIRSYGGKKALASFEAMAIAPILVVLKLLLGFDGVTENCVSHIGTTLKKLGMHSGEIFVWKDWQRALECRQAVLVAHHYPTREQLVPDAAVDPKTASSFLEGVYRDPYWRERIYQGNKVYDKYDRLMEDQVAKVMERLLTLSTKPTHAAPAIHPSLTPGVSRLQDIVSWIRASGRPDPPWMDVLVKDWSSLNIDYLVNPQEYLEPLMKAEITVKTIPQEWFKAHLRRAVWMKDTLDSLSESQLDVKYEATLSQEKVLRKFNTKRRERHLLPKPLDGEVLSRPSWNYWRLEPEDTMWTIKEFEEDIMPLFSSSWSWLLKQCSGMLHMCPRDIYKQVLKFEDSLIEAIGPKNED